MAIPVEPNITRDVMSKSLSMIIVDSDLLEGFLSCKYNVLMRSPLWPGVSVPTNVPIMETLHDSFIVYFNPTVSIIFFQRRPFNKIVRGIMRNETMMYSIFELTIILYIL